MIAYVHMSSSVMIVVEYFSEEENVSDSELVFISLCFAWFAIDRPADTILVNGVQNHPLASMSRLTPEMIEAMRECQ